MVTGSFNFTKAAEQKNAENLSIIKSPEFGSYTWQITAQPGSLAFILERAKKSTRKMLSDRLLVAPYSLDNAEPFA